MARMTLQLPDRVRERLEHLKDVSDAASISEVIRRALAVYEMVLDEDVSGGKVLFERDGTTRQLVVR